jgi:hypothetical protein
MKRTHLNYQEETRTKEYKDIPNETADKISEREAFYNPASLKDATKKSPTIKMKWI